MVFSRGRSARRHACAAGLSTLSTPGRRGRSRSLISLALVALLAFPNLHGAGTLQTARAAAPQLQFTSVDTMKDSMDTDAWGLNTSEIADDVNLSASLNPSYITVDTHMDYPAYMAEWVNAVRATRKHVWFRVHWNNWEGDNGTSANMTPGQYLAQLSAFITQNRALFQPGDILDGCPEPENSPYWVNTFGPVWSWSPAAPNHGSGRAGPPPLCTRTF